MSHKGPFSEFLSEHIRELDNDEELLELRTIIREDDMKNLLEATLADSLEAKT